MNKVLMGFTAGLLVGILFAPDKGSRTREQLARQGRDLKDKFGDMIDSVCDRFESVQEEAQEMAERAKETMRS